MKNKISNTGKKKLKRQIKIWLKDIKAFMKDYGFCKEDNYYQEIIDLYGIILMNLILFLGVLKILIHVLL